jgi:2-iminobutanoate/2-iminopropanoate deaminase
MMQIIRTPNATTPKGPYSQGILSNGFVFVAGQIPFDTAGLMVVGGIEEQTRAVLGNVREVLRAAGSGLDRVVKTTVFLSDLSNFVRMNAVYAEFFPSNPPVRSTVQVGLAPGMLVEIECVAEA